MARRHAPPFTVQAEALTSRENVPYNGYAHAFAGMGIQFLLFSALNLGIEMLVEREKGLWARLRSAPVSRFLIIGGKIASITIISLMTLLVSFGFAMLMFKAVVVSVAETTGVGGDIGITIVSLTASGRNSYVAPRTFAWTKVAPSRVTENRVCVSANWYGQSPVDRLSELTGRQTPSHRWNVGSWCISMVPSGLTTRSQPGPYVTDRDARGWAASG